MTCHEDRSLRSAAGKALFVDGALFRRSQHGQAAVVCVDCHRDLRATAGFPHKEKLVPAACHDCHAKTESRFTASVHGETQVKLGGRALGCADCHDAHAVVTASDPASPISPFHVAELCLKCHRTAQPETRGREARFVASYEESVHARALRRSGLAVSATCTTCHDSHDVKRVTDAASPVARTHIPATCGSCHRGILAVYETSIHGRGLSAGDPKTPVCTDCHGEHTVERASVARSKVFPRNVPDTCGRCHGDARLVAQRNLATKRVSSFRSSFHGIALRFGELKVANCASCHGYHDILPASDPRSRVHPANIPRTCGACHPNAGTNWARGKVHAAEPRDNYAAHLTLEAYKIIIGASMSLFVLYIGADLWAWRRRRKARK
jgi:hypothetical protein